MLITEHVHRNDFVGNNSFVLRICFIVYYVMLTQQNKSEKEYICRDTQFAHKPLALEQ